MKNFSFLLLLLPAFSFSQNGLTSYAMPTGYTTTQVRYKNALAIDNSGNKWVGFRDIGLGKFDGTNWTMFNKSNSGLPCDTVTSIAIDPSNTLWIGTYRGLVKYNGSNWTIYNKSNSGIVSDTITAVALLGTTVYADSNHGLSAFNGSWTTYNKSGSGIASDTIKSITTEPTGTVWVGTRNGLSKLIGINWSNYNSANSGLKKNYILSLYADAGNLWIGTNNSGGIYEYSSGVINMIDSLYPNPPLQYPTGAFSFTKGFLGGILFNWDGINLAEIIPSTSQLKIYFLPSSIIGTRIFNRDASGLIWFINQNGYDTTRNKLFSFDLSQYTQPADCMTLTTDNAKMLDINQVSAAILNRGDLHWNPTNTSHGQYEVPTGSGIYPVFTSAIWIAGQDSSNQIHGAGEEYRGTFGCDYFPGPINAANPATFDKIWKVDRYKIEEFKYYWANGNVQNGTYTPDQNILTWPAIADTSYAPFVDVDANGIYDPLTGGDYPKIKGDQCLYFIMNDNGIHANTQCLPMEVEIHGMAYAFTCPQLPDSEQTLNYTTFYHYEFINKSINTYHKSYFGYWQDSDLGCATDDYVGCYPSGNYGYYYNGDSIDVSCSGETGYGKNPPMLSTLILNGALADVNDSIDNDNDGIVDEPNEKNLMTAFGFLIGGYAYPQQDPGTCSDYYNYMSAHWQGGWPFTYGGMGLGGTTPTHFLWPDFPYDINGWNELTTGNTPGDRRMIIGSGPFTLQAGASVDYDWAIVWSRDTTLPFMSKAFFDKNLHDNQKIQQWFAADSFPSCLLLNVGVNETNTNANVVSVYPNPTSGIFNLKVQQFENLPVHSGLKMKDIEIYNVYGEKVYSIQLTQSTPLNIGYNSTESTQFAINLSDKPSGIFFLQLRTTEGVVCRKIILSR